VTSPPEALGSGTTLVPPVRRSPVAASAHLRALDGWRGIAVAAVVLFHAELVPGGWLGVDLFFVLSGFLITRLLVLEHRRTDAVSMRGFWARRARRLLPALVVFFAGVALYAWWYPQPVNLPGNLAGEMGASVGYVANWFQLSGSAGYWDTYVAPSPLKHMWSLAIEEQFYILFPIVMVGVLGLARRSSARVCAVLGAAAVASWAWGLWLLAHGAGFERVYLGTDTRVGAVLIGAAAGHASVTPSLRNRAVRLGRRVAPVAAVGVLLALVVVDGSADWTAWRWLVLPTFELGVCALLLHATDEGLRRRPLQRGAGAAPLVWLGTISYGLYLWHFPALLVAGNVLADGPRWLAITVAIAVAVALAALSSRWLEQPLRRARLSAGAWTALGVVAVAVVAAAIVSVHHSSAEARAYQDRRAGAEDVVTDVIAAAGDGPLRPAAAPPERATVPAAATPPPPLPLPTLPLPRPEGRPARVLLLGDSMALDLSDGFRRVADDFDVTPSTSSMIGCAAGGMDLYPGSRDLGSPAQVARCDEWRASWPDVARTAAPDVALITRVSARRATPELVGSEDVCSPQYLDWYREQLRGEIAALTPHVGVIAYAGPVYARFALTRDAASDRAADCIAAATEEVTLEHDHVVHLPLGDWVCPTPDSCITEVDGITLRPDGMHFQDRGADVAVVWVLHQLYG